MGIRLAEAHCHDKITVVLDCSRLVCPDCFSHAIDFDAIQNPTWVENKHLAVVACHCNSCGSLFSLNLTK